MATPLVTSPRGKKVAYMDCGTPICSLIYTLTQPAFAKLDVKLVRIKTGFAADAVASGFDTVVSSRYNGVLVAALPGPLWASKLPALKTAGIPVSTVGITDADPTKVPVEATGLASATRAARLLANYVVTSTSPSFDTKDIVFYVTPELSFTPVMLTVFKQQLATLCSNCTVRSVNISAGSLGTTSATTVINDLQAHPNTKLAVFPVGEQATGLPAALKAAGLKITTISANPDPQALQQVKNGEMAASLGLDFGVLGWTLADSMARLMTGQKLEPAETDDQPVWQFLTRKELSGYDLSNGWSGYTDFVTRFTKLWSAAK